MAYSEDSGNITFAFTGDAMPTRRFAVHDEPEFLAVARLLRTMCARLTGRESNTLEYEIALVPSDEQDGDRGALLPR